MKFILSTLLLTVVTSTFAMDCSPLEKKLSEYRASHNRKAYTEQKRRVRACHNLNKNIKRKAPNTTGKRFIKQHESNDKAINK